MFNVCPKCGEYSVEKTIDPAGPFAICPFCHHPHPFLQQPLFIITGSSGAGKTTLTLELVSRLRECVVMESDILWGENQGQGNDDNNVWLRIAKNIGQAGRPVVLCGTALPEQLENSPERRYFSKLHYLALVCDDELLEERLKRRPEWRESGSEEFIQWMVQFNRWLKNHANTTTPPMTLYDTSHPSIGETTQNVMQWIRERLSPTPNS
ncbi:AAA family ATPase [Ktedonospora formicarum]|uniref:Nucleoside kinase n=1 Tax=Ktedonospora formicarum TaxID=2778364 RepID=A0A8J3I3E8_9CHLR|nr:AAA family ATPase [Ktedonospora formicarum]GHO49427.1 nucleoside kinase [Ktedonospora formicarum]